MDDPRKSVSRLLQGALSRRQKQNPLLSQRSLAVSLRLSPSYLSKVFRGERPFPHRLLGRLAKFLQLDHHEVAEIQRLLLRQMEKENLSSVTGIQTTQVDSKSPASQYHNKSGVDLWLLEEWFYLPILNLVTTEGFKPEDLASRLGISEARAESAVRRFVECGYLERMGDGSLRRTELRFRFPTQRSIKQVREFHKKMIEKTLLLLNGPSGDQEFSERLISGINFAGDPRLLPDAKIIIEEALYRAAEVLAGGNCTEIFQINLQLFKLTRPG